MTTGRSLRIGEAVLGGGVLALGLFIVSETALLEVAPVHAAVGPTLFPYLVGGGLIVIGVLVLYQAGFGHIAHERGFELDWVAVVLISAGLVAQMFLLEWLGWIPSTTLLFMAVARSFGSRRLLIDALLGLALTSLVFVIFNYGLDLTLPGGVLGDLLAPGKATQ
jgi:putative tricarboxylic transport membrane protein